MKGASFIHLLEGRGKINAKEVFASILKREIIIDEISKVRIYKKGTVKKRDKFSEKSIFQIFKRIFK